MEHSPGWITSWVTNQASENLRKLKLYQVSFLTTMLCNLISITGKEKKTIKITNTWRLNNTLLNNQQVTEDIKKVILKIPTNEKTMKTQ